MNPSNQGKNDTHEGREKSKLITIDFAAMETYLQLLPACHKEKLASLKITLAGFSELASLAIEANQGSLIARIDFENWLSRNIACRPSPPRPKTFAIQAIASGPAHDFGISFPSLSRFPCFLPPFLFGQIGRAFLDNVIDHLGPKGDPADDRFWAGLWSVFSIARELEPLSIVYRAGQRLDSGEINLERFQRIAAFATDMPGKSCSEPTAVSLQLPLPFPGLGGKFLDTCRFLQWRLTEDAIRCACLRSYLIDEIVNCTEGREPVAIACIGDCIDIRGSGFGTTRRRDAAGRLNDVLFPATDGSFVAATTFLVLPAIEDEDGEVTTPENPSGWSDTHIKAVVPEGAIEGDIQLRISCTRNASGGVFDPVKCPDSYRRREILSNSFMTVFGPPSVTLDLQMPSGEFVEVATESASFDVEACRAVEFRILAISAETVMLTDETGAEIPLEDLAEHLPATFRARVSFSEQEEKTYTLTVANRCIDRPLIREVTVRRIHYVKLEPARQTIIAGSSGSLVATTSCPLPEGGVVTLSSATNWSGLGFPVGLEAMIAPGSQRSNPVRLSTRSDLCGISLVNGALTSGSSIAHQEGSARVEVQAVDVSMLIDVVVSGVIQPSVLSISTLSRTLRDLPAVFTADRNRLLVELPPSFSVGSGVTVVPAVPLVEASYDGTTGNIRFNLSVTVSRRPFGDGTVEISFDNRSDLRDEFGRLAPVGLPIGQQTRTDRGMEPIVTYDTTVVGAGTVSGGPADDRRLAIGLTLIFPSPPPKRCNEEPYDA